ncbi:MAG: hypothetical protein ACXVEF_08925 [Polyangiales bacterium]
MVLHAENPTMLVGERAWFVKRGPDGAVVWAMIRPFDDGSAALRTATDMRTCAPPDGPRDALAIVDVEGFVELSKARELGVVPPDAAPPAW